MRLKNICFALTFFVLNSLSAQVIKGRVVDRDHKPVPGATVFLNRKDSSGFRTVATGNKGDFSFGNISKGDYFMRVRSLESGDTSLSLFSFAGIEDLSIQIVLPQGKTKELDNITVTAKRQLVEVKGEKIIFNVENSINATGMDAVELLKRSPGIIVDQNESISIAGRNGVQIYIDGKISPLQDKDLANYLRSIQSSMIESIEIISNPSSKFDAAGTGGIINIKLKKNKQFGTNGSLNGNYSLGVYSKYLAGISLNHRNAKINVFSNYNYSNGITYDELDVYRQLSDSSFDLYSKTKNYRASQNFKGGLDYFISQKHTIGTVVTINSSVYERPVSSRTYISNINSGGLDRILIANNTNDGFSRFKDFDLNYRFAISKDRELTADFDYGLFDIKNDQYQPNEFFDSTGKLPLYEQNYSINTRSDIHLLTGKVDYNQGLFKGVFNTGLKYINAKTDNSIDFFNHDAAGASIPDSSRNNDFFYTETIKAAYATFERTIKKISINAGLRLENTNTNGRSLGYTDRNGSYQKFDTSFYRRYTDLFPTLFLTYKHSDYFTMGASYRQSIRRPAYADLNPFESRLDAYSYFKGNPELRPEYADSYGLTMNWKFGLTASLNYTNTKNKIVSLSDTLDQVKSYYGPVNMGKSDNYSAILTYNYSKKWYSLVTSVTGFYIRNRADFDDRPVDIKAKGVSINLQQNFKLNKSWMVEITAKYNSPSLFRGIMKTSSNYNIDAGIQYGFHKGRGSLRITCADFLKLWDWDGTSDFAGQYILANYEYESRLLGISLTWRFGKTQFRQINKKTGNEESTNRATGSSQNQ